ncbi:hypothetical protein [Legionella cincinnatiensis]|uniref:Uncharacterized protein n=1 Tax=Legionella cincinnatiensis TaxID=28085 RepID=A0A378IHM4_9GAMM|nr:hypothetical protein [Legionella cincinnatiensis]KTC83610.1 hypothetical protein Lcin_2297 [Legionella cincinnatiensis]STX34430.1 Uncharacterised protein [Legionella cincinnatiensis]
MFIKPLIVVLGIGLYFSPILAVADETKTCNATQQGNCERFCQGHQGAKSCIIDITQRSGTCTCVDGTSHTK